MKLGKKVILHYTPPPHIPHVSRKIICKKESGSVGPPFDHAYSILNRVHAVAWHTFQPLNMSD
jgi:hypothetical protein